MEFIQKRRWFTPSSILNHIIVGLCFVFFVNISAWAALVEVKQISDPAGFVDETDIVNTGGEFSSIQPSLSTNGYVFGYWSTGGTRLTDDGGRSVTKATVQVDAALTLTAHYFLENEDSDEDGIRDWFEWRNFGGLTETLNGDPDYDNFTNGQEDMLGQEPTIKDLVEDGGISSRASIGFVFADTSMVKYVVKSDPVGFVNTSEAFVEQNTTIATPNLHGETNGYQFAYWSMNGVRQASANGVAVSQVIAEVNASSTFIAHYVPSGEDNDTDGILDWFELYQFGHLNQGPNDDPDYDNFSNAQESALGQEATIKDLVEDGGISSRASVGFVFADTSMVKYIVKSDPVGFVNTSEAFVELNVTVATPNLHGQTNGYHFAYWSMNGVRQASANGVAVSQVIAEISQPTTFVAHYIPSNEDSDADGIMDWFELYQFGHLNQGPNDDPDYDNFSNAQESTLGQEATIKDLVQDGGISARASVGLLYYLQNDPVPSIEAPYHFALDLGKTFSHTVNVTGQMDQMSITGSLPPGILFNAATTTFAGIPIELGSYSIIVTVNGGTHTVTQGFTFDVLHAPSIVTELLAPDAGVGDYFGASVDLRDQWAVVGANLADVNGEVDAGAAYLFEVEANASSDYKTKVVASSPEANAEFGLSVAVDHPWLIVGAPKTDANGLADSGSAYLYKIESNGSVTFVEELLPQNADQQANALFGHSVAIDGNHILIGAPGDGINGEAFLFVIDSAGYPGDGVSVVPDDSLSGDEFGFSVSISDTTLAVGAPGSDNAQGASYVFDLAANGEISQAGKITRGENASNSDRVGQSVAVHEQSLLSGAPKATSEDGSSGGLYLETSLSEYSVPQATNERRGSRNSGDDFGQVISIERVEENPIYGLGRPMADPDGQPNAGIFNLANGTNYPLKAPSPQANDEFGIAGVVDGKRALVGAWKRDPNFLANAGAAYLFHNPDWGESVGNIYQLAISVTGPGEVEGAGVYLENATATISATPNTGAEFLGWSGAGVTDNNAVTTTVTMTQDLNISATFGMITKDLIVSVNGQGEANGTGTYLLGTNVSIEAIPADGHNFTGWSGIGAANPGLAATTVFMSSDRNLTANFAINEYNLVINPSNGGVENGVGIYEHGQQANISADPNFGMIFLNWNGDGISDSNSPNTTVDMTQDRTISASYANGSSVASLFMSGGEIVEDQDAGINTATFSVRANGKSVSGFSFSLVTGPNGETGNNNLFSFSADQEGALTSKVSLDFETHGSPLSVFVKADNGNGVVFEEQFSIVLRDSDGDVPSTFELVLIAEDGGEVSGAGTFEAGTQANIVAVESSGFVFTNWSGLGVSDPFSSNTSVSMTANRTITALFKNLDLEAVLEISQSEFKENLPIGSIIGSVSAVARNQKLEGFTFSLVNEQGDAVSSSDLFSIDPQSGEVQILKSLDFETSESTISLSVRADKNSETTLTDSLSLTLVDVNEPPILTLADNRVELTENTGTFVTSALASDPEASPLTFGISKKLDHANFSINVATGEISFQQSPDFENPADANGDNTYNIELTVSDGKNLVAKTLEVKVKDDPLDTLEIVSNPIQISVEEGLPAGIEIASFSFGDKTDASFSLVADENADMHHFFLTPEGQLLTMESLRQEHAEQHLLVVEAKLANTVKRKKVFVRVIENTSPVLEKDDYSEWALMIRDTRVVNDPLRTGLNIIDDIKTTSNGVIVTTNQPHGRKTGDSVVLADVKGISVNEVKNWNFMIDQVEEKSFRLNTFEKIDGKYTGKIGSPINTSGKFETGFLLGQWTFGHLLGNMVGEQDDPMDFLKHFLSQWTFEQTINGWPTDKKRKIFNGINTSFAKLPFRLLAIGNRLDLFKATSVHDIHDAGEGRFVFCMTGSFSEVEEAGFLVNKGNKINSSFIFEYGQKATNFETLSNWTEGWHKLSMLRGDPEIDPSDQYLEHLAEMGDRFTKRGADPDKTNGNSINQVRTNEFVLLPRVWQFREFNLLDRNDPRIKEFSITADRDLKSKGTLGGQAGLWTTTTKGNPMVNEFRNHSILANWINQRESQILDGEVSPAAPEWMVGGIANQPGFRSFSFKPAGVHINLARHKFSLSTCSGCHNGDTKTAFFMLEPRNFNEISFMPSFLTGGSVVDVVNDNESHFYHDLGQREKNMKNLLSAVATVQPKGLRLTRVDIPGSTKSGEVVAAINMIEGSAVAWKYDLIQGVGDDDNDAFEIAGANLKLKNESTVGSLSIRIKATALDANGQPDSTGVTFQRPYAIFKRKGADSTQIPSQSFDMASLAIPPLVTPNPNRVH